MSLCVYAIFRDEVDRVPDWVATTADADHRIVLDTGSLDGTPEALAALGVDVRFAWLDPFRFDDARNMALALVPPTIDWCLRLDADERLGNGWREAFELVVNPKVPRYRYVVVNHGEGWGVHTRNDLHARSGFHWRYPTHETLEGPNTYVDVPGLLVHHLPSGRRVHHDRNLRVLADAAAREPHDHRMAFYYARELWYTGQYGLCRGELSRFLDLPGGWPPERAEAYRILAAIDDYPERWLWKAVGECPQRREPWVDLARHAVRNGDWTAAGIMLAMADRCTDTTIYTTSQEAWGPSYDALRAAVLANIQPTPPPEPVDQNDGSR
jgi:hypothetical protein